MHKYTLRTAAQSDAEFLFDAKRKAMEPTSVLLGKFFDRNKEFEEYLSKFEPEKVQVIEYGGMDIGRLRVVRSQESIYIGGIQILPEFQGKGIGASILADIVSESESSGIPITLEVHHVNEKAIAFYMKLGFEETGRTEEQLTMKYTPRQHPEVRH